MKYIIAALLLPALVSAQEPAAAEHGKRYDRLLIRNVYIIDGNGTPISGPTSVVVENDRIASVGGARGEFDAVIDGEGRYLLPGFINLHAHLQDGRGGISMPFQYQFDLWLACGITTLRDVGSDRTKALRLRDQSASGEVRAPRIFLYMRAGGGTAEQARESVRRIKEAGGDGIKIGGMEREPLVALLDEAKKLGLRVAHHVGVEETDAWDDIRGGTTSIEHWYGIPDAAIPYGSQQFPPDYNYSNELDRFRWAGRLFKDADQEKLSRVLQAMVDAGVAWDPTLSIYEASRNLNAAQNQPWFKDYLHPALEKFFEASPRSHGSFFFEWTTQDEIEWKRNYQLWFKALREFAERGGTIGAGEDAGFIYRMHGFGLLHELELHQEAGFHPLDVIKHATGNNAKILGMEHELGRVKAGFKADLILVNGNPLRNLKYLYPTGTGVYENGEASWGGTIEWTIKDGFVYKGSILMENVRTIVKDAREEREASSGGGTR
ncbi:MAG: amidohydrolase family protein [Armatimonadetes bacterium]|nr:amidohydrolase family protein [Armatimonadota bacterium]